MKNKKYIGFIFNFYNNWRFKDFALGLHLSSKRFTGYREYYILFSLGFWQLAIGFELYK